MFKYLSDSEKNFFVIIYNLIILAVVMICAAMGLRLLSYIMFQAKTPPEHVIEMQKLCIEKRGTWQTGGSYCYFNN